MKKFTQFCISFVFLFVLLSPVGTCQARDLFMDLSGLMTSDEETILESEMSRLSHVLGYSVGAVTYEYSAEYEQWIDENGPDYIVMAVNMRDRRMDLNVGGTAFYALDDADKDLVLDEVAPYLTAGKYEDAFYTFVTMTESYVTGVMTEKELERQKIAAWEEKMPMITMSIVLSVLVAGGVTYGFVKSMNNVNDQENAAEYQGQLYISRDKEIFLYRNVVSTPRQQNHGGGGGGGGGGRGSYSSGRSRGF